MENGVILRSSVNTQQYSWFKDLKCWLAARYDYDKLSDSLVCLMKTDFKTINDWKANRTLIMSLMIEASLSPDEKSLYYDTSKLKYDRDKSNEQKEDMEWRTRILRKIRDHYNSLVERFQITLQTDNDNKKHTYISPKMI